VLGVVVVLLLLALLPDELQAVAASARTTIDEAMLRLPRMCVDPF
jgi:hypothetical protein